jgi:hypothetical protein
MHQFEQDNFDIRNHRRPYYIEEYHNLNKLNKQREKRLEILAYIISYSSLFTFVLLIAYILQVLFPIQINKIPSSSFSSIFPWFLP